MSLPHVKRCKLGAQPTSTYNINASTCQRCSDRDIYFKEKFNEISDKMHKLQEIIVNQNNIIMKALAEQKLLAERIIHQEDSCKNVLKSFPIKNIDDLKDLNNAICEENRDVYVNTMKLLLKGRLPKTLTEVLSVNVIMEVNMDGVHGKKRLKDFKSFYQSFADACRSLGFNEVEKEIRNALKIIKKRHIHAECVKNKNLKPKDMQDSVIQTC